jgi:hypothetical protein
VNVFEVVASVVRDGSHSDHDPVNNKPLTAFGNYIESPTGIVAVPCNPSVKS